MKEKLRLMPKNRGFVAKLVVVTSLVLTMTILGATYAYQRHENELDNLLKAHNISGTIIENGVPTGEQEDFAINPGGAPVSKEVKFENTSDSGAAVFVRVAYAQTWMDEDGALLAYDSTYATPNWSSAWTSQWIDGGDGWYYYNEVLKAGDITLAVLESVNFASSLPGGYATGQYQLTFMMEVVQCSDEEEVNEAASLATFGKKATVSDMTTENGAVTGGTVSWDQEERRCKKRQKWSQ